MKSPKPHRNLDAWKKGMHLVTEIYTVTKRFPVEEMYGLISQLRRAAVSVPANIAEGAAGRSAAQFYQGLSLVIGSLNEIDTQWELARRLNYVSEANYDRLTASIDECLALTYGLRKSIAPQVKSK